MNCVDRARLLQSANGFRGYPHYLGEALAIRFSSKFHPATALVLVTTMCAVYQNAQAQVVHEYAKADSLFNFVKFVEWPSQTFADDSSPLIVGLVGDDSSSGVIDQTINGKTANGRRLVVKRFSNFKALTFCHIVFVRSSERDRIRQTLEATGPGTLTVGETEGFANWGGIINLTIVGGKLRLEINQTSAERAGLKISAKLLSLARVTRD